MSKLNKIIYLDSAEQFVELYQNGTVTKANGTVVTYNENDLYLIAKKPITVDSELNGTSTNPVQNKVLYQLYVDLHGDVNNKIDYGSDSGYLVKLRCDELVSEATSGNTITITPTEISIGKEHQDNSYYTSHIFGQAPNTSPQSTNTEFYLPGASGTLATEEETTKFYRHELALIDALNSTYSDVVLISTRKEAYTNMTDVGYDWVHGVIIKVGGHVKFPESEGGDSGWLTGIVGDANTGIYFTYSSKTFLSTITNAVSPPIRAIHDVPKLIT